MATLAERSPDPIQNPLESLVGYQLRRVSSLWMGDLARGLEQFALRPSEASVLVLIGANPQITQSEIGRILGIKRANMAPLCAALERRELLLRTPVDGRSQGLTLTQAGAAVTASVQRLMRDHDLQHIARLSPAQRERLTALLNALRD